MKASWNVYKQLSATLSLQREMQISMFHPMANSSMLPSTLKEDGIIVYSIDSQKGTLVQIGFQPTGLYPRSFAISPDGCYLAVVCRDANCIQIFERNRNTGLLKNTGKNIRLERPAFVKFL